MEIKKLRFARVTIQRQGLTQPDQNLANILYSKLRDTTIRDRTVEEEEIYTSIFDVVPKGSFSRYVNCLVVDLESASNTGFLQNEILDQQSVEIQQLSNSSQTISGYMFSRLYHFHVEGNLLVTTLPGNRSLASIERLLKKILFNLTNQEYDFVITPIMAEATIRDSLKGGIKGFKISSSDQDDRTSESSTHRFHSVLQNSAKEIMQLMGINQEEVENVLNEGISVEVIIRSNKRGGYTDENNLDDDIVNGMMVDAFRNRGKEVQVMGKNNTFVSTKEVEYTREVEVATVSSTWPSTVDLIEKIQTEIENYHGSSQRNL